MYFFCSLKYNKNKFSEGFRFSNENKRYVNAKDVSVQLYMQHVTVRLPRNVYSDLKSSKLFIFEVHLDVRDISQYIDIHLTTSPVTVTVPISERSEHDFVSECYPGLVPHLRLEGRD